MKHIASQKTKTLIFRRLPSNASVSEIMVVVFKTIAYYTVLLPDNFNSVHRFYTLADWRKMSRLESKWEQVDLMKCNKNNVYFMLKRINSSWKVIRKNSSDSLIYIVRVSFDVEYCMMRLVRGFHFKAWSSNFEIFKYIIFS